MTKVNALRPRTLGFAAGVSNRASGHGSRHCQRDRRSARCQLGFRPSRRTPLSLRQRTTASEWRMSSSWRHPLLCWPAPLLGGRVIIQPRTVGSTWTIAAYGSTRSRSRISSIASSDTRLCGSHRWPGRSARWACGCRLLYTTRFIVTRNRDYETPHRRNFVSHGPARVR